MIERASMHSFVKLQQGRILQAENGKTGHQGLAKRGHGVVGAVVLDGIKAGTNGLEQSGDGELLAQAGRRGCHCLTPPNYGARGADTYDKDRSQSHFSQVLNSRPGIAGT